MDFLATKHYKIKTQKMCKSISQGLLMSADNFGWSKDTVNHCIIDNNGKKHKVIDESRFLTKQLKVTYAIAQDNKRKAKSVDKYTKMAQRQGKKFSKQPYRWLMKRTWGKKLLFLFYGRQNDKRVWPSWVTKTDEERIQNIPWILNDTSSTWIATEKIDGSSATYSLKKKKRKGHYDFYVCSRNVVMDSPNKECYYDTNVYQEMAQKYNIKNTLIKLIEKEPVFKNCEWITIQGEIYGPKIQKRDYHTPEHGLMIFNLIDSEHGRWNTIEMKNLIERYYGIPCVPIVNESFHLPATVEELLSKANGKSILDGEMREGLVFRSPDGTRSFKAVSNEYLLKYHNN